MTATTDKIAGLIERLRAAHPNSKPIDIDATVARWKAKCAAEYAEYCERHADDVVEDDTETLKRQRRPLIFRERDVTRAIAGHLKAGLSVARTEIDSAGRIVIVTGQPEPNSITPVPANDWETL